MKFFDASIAILALRTVIPAIQSEGGLILKCDLLQKISFAIGYDMEIARDCLDYAESADLVEIDGILVSE